MTPEQVSRILARLASLEYQSIRQQQKIEELEGRLKEALERCEDVEDRTYDFEERVTALQERGSSGVSDRGETNDDERRIRKTLEP